MTICDPIPINRGSWTSAESSTTNSSSSSAIRFGLNVEDPSPVFIFDYHGGIERSSQADLAARLDKDPSQRVTKKPIDRGSAYVDVLQHDLYLPEEQERGKHYPSYDAWLASIKLPSRVYWGRLFFGTYDQLYIISPERKRRHSDDKSNRSEEPVERNGQRAE